MSGRQFLRYCPPIEHRALPALRPPTFMWVGVGLHAGTKEGKGKVEDEAALAAAVVLQAPRIVPKDGMASPDQDIRRLTRPSICSSSLTCRARAHREIPVSRKPDLRKCFLKLVWFSFEDFATWNSAKVSLLKLVLREFRAIDRRSSWK